MIIHDVTARPAREDELRFRSAIAEHVADAVILRDAADGEILHSLERDGVWSGEVEQVRKDGGRVWCSVSVSAFEHPGRGTVWTSVHTDVTARRAADETLRAADQRFQRLFEVSPVGIALVSAELRLIDANPALCAITGFDRDDLVGRRLEDIAHPDDAPDKLELARGALAGEIPQHRAESRFITKRGDVVNVARQSPWCEGPTSGPPAVS